MPIQRRDFFRSAACASVALGILPDLMTGPALAAASDSGLDAGVLPPGAISRFAQLNGIRLHYVVAGSGPPLVLLHGWPQTWAAWRGTMAALSDRFTLIAPDLRGLGLSERTVSGYDKRTIAEDIRALIDHEAGGRARVLGHDMGGKAAYVLAHRHPDRVSRLALVDCLLPGTENMDSLRGGAWHYGFHMAPDIPEMLTAGRERAYIREQIRAWSRRKDAVTEDAINEYARHYASPGGMRAGFNHYRALRDDAALAATFAGKRLTMPVLAIAGRYGVGSRLSDALKGEASSLTTVIVEESGHFVAEEAPDAFQRAVAQFMTA
ncbi:alpha/beta hydrolase [Methylobacterium sp. W2]|nr:alpha/beta hydrolase [Methylobacterium sp. W2]